MERTFSEALKNRRTYYSDYRPVTYSGSGDRMHYQSGSETRAVGIQFSIYPCGASSWQVS